MTDGKIPAETTGGDGGDVAGQRNPDTIQREIEQTRAELADTIDAIADRLSPKRVASRGASAVKAQVTSVFNGNGDSADGTTPPATGGYDAAARHQAVREVAASGGGGAYTGTSQFTISRRLRVDRVLLTVGAVAAIAGAVVLWRSRD
jgi:hypothetical protein